MNDPIRAALDKAAEEVLKNLKDRRGIRQAIEQCDADVHAELGRTVAAKAIAAFLRALPDNRSPATAMWWYSVPAEMETHHWLAEAVLAAAKEEAND
jgi:hypothetical protein